MLNPLLDTSSLPRFADLAPDQVVAALTELIAAHRQKLEALLDGTPNPDFDSIVTPLEEMEHELSRVWSPVSHLQGVLGSHEWRDAYNAALPLMTDAAGLCCRRRTIGRWRLPGAEKRGQARIA
jgi:oligopeptidase A